MIKPVKFTKEFTGNGEDFSAFNEASEFLTKHGFSSGSMQREAPIGLMKGDVMISKWRNLSKSDIETLDGVIKFPEGSPRAGKTVVELYIDFQE